MACRVPQLAAAQEGTKSARWANAPGVPSWSYTGADKAVGRQSGWRKRQEHHLQ